MTDLTIATPKLTKNCLCAKRYMFNSVIGLVTTLKATIHLPP